MCLTIPKKVIEIRGGGIVVAEDIRGDRQEFKTIVQLEIGDYVATQQNMVIQKMEKEEAEEIFDMINSKGDF
ncbi:MAG TPA: hypothetical protein DCX32_00540 [Candidatus Moranbacteria bacterium]|nr:hypothetical protein [Candidatus Moranbacteria bacterium]